MPNLSFDEWFERVRTIVKAIDSSLEAHKNYPSWQRDHASGLSPLEAVKITVPHLFQNANYCKRAELAAASFDRTDDSALPKSDPDYLEITRSVAGG